MQSAPDEQVTFAAAAVLCGVHIDTIRRHHRAGCFPGAVREARTVNAKWLVTRADLVAAGLLDAPGVEPAAATASTASTMAALLAMQEQEIAFLRQQVTDLRGVLAGASA